MPRRKVEIIVEFEVNEDAAFDDIVNAVVAAVEDTATSAANVFADVVTNEEIG